MVVLRRDGYDRGAGTRGAAKDVTTGPAPKGKGPPP